MEAREGATRVMVMVATGQGGTISESAQASIVWYSETTSMTQLKLKECLVSI